ncbi:MAG: hypothetical protein ABIR00_02825 [Nitrosospira sp.]
MQNKPAEDAGADKSRSLPGDPVKDRRIGGFMNLPQEREEHKAGTGGAAMIHPAHRPVGTGNKDSLKLRASLEPHMVPAVSAATSAAPALPVHARLTQHPFHAESLHLPPNPISGAVRNNQRAILKLGLVTGWCSRS